MRFPFRRKALSASPDLVESLQERTASLFATLGGTNQANARIKASFARAQSAGYGWMYANSPAVRSVVDLITRNVSQLDLRLYEELDAVTRDIRPDHPAALSLRYPSDTQTSDQFVRAMVQDYLVFNNAYALKFRTPGLDRVILKHIPSHRVEVFGMGLFDPDGYRIWRLDGTSLDVGNPADMMHWRGYHAEDARVGLSPLETLRNVIAEDAALQTAIIELMKAGLAGPMWVFRPDTAPEWSNPARKGFEEDLANRLKQSNRKTPVMEEGMELRPMGVSPRDAQMLEVRRWAVHQVCGLYGVPVEMLGLGVGRGADLNVSQSEFYADTLPPICQSFTNQLGLSILQQEYDEKAFLFQFDLDAKHMGDDRLRALTSATGRPVLLTNEARAMVNRPPVDGGDELVTPLNVIVGENPKPSPDMMGIQDPNGPAQDGSGIPGVGGGGRGQTPPQEKPPPSEPTPSETHSGAVSGKSDPIPRLHPGRSGDMSRQKRYVEEAQALMERYYARQARSLRSKADVDLERWNRELAGDIHELMASIVAREGAIYVSRLAGSDFDMGRVKNYLRAASAGIAEAVNHVTSKDIEAVGLESALARAQGERAAVAGTSIGARAAIFARLEAANQAPDPQRRMKVWIADKGRHAQLDGDTVPVGDDWPAGFAPGSAPGCACTAAVI